VNRSSWRSLAAGIIAAALSLGSAPLAHAQVVPPAPSPGGVVKPPLVPKPPWASIGATATSVTVRWSDQSTNEDGFVVYRRDKTGAWQALREERTRGSAALSGEYTYVDTDTSLSGQCYMVAAAGATGTGYSPERCVVRPDPTQYPQDVPDAVQQWMGLSDDNGGTGNLYNTSRSESLQEEDHVHTVSLGWTSGTALWRIQAQGGPHLVRGQAVALKVWGGGWLKYSPQNGVYLSLSSTPSYEWHLVGGKPWDAIHYNTFAMWNSVARDYLVAGYQSKGVQLKWSREPEPSTGGGTGGGGTGGGGTPVTGYRSIQVSNCHVEERPLEMWVKDLTAGGGWVDHGELDPQYNGAACPYAGSPWTYTLQSGHYYVIEAVDLWRDGCSNDPDIGDCWRSQIQIVGDANGPVSLVTIV
jgi:hypothetical protein